MSYLIEVTHFTHHGRAFTAKIYQDSDSGPPWENDYGAGVVIERRIQGGDRRTGKRPWERVLYSNRTTVWLMDMRATREKALKDGWGVSEKDRKVLWINPTKKQIAARAVELEFDRLRRYLNDDWCYVGVVVEDDLSGEEESLWGVESYPPEYIQEVANELASELHPLAEREDCAVLSEN